MADAERVRGQHEQRKIAAAAVGAGEVWQLADGRAAVYTGLNAAASGDRVGFTTEGQFNFPKTASVVPLPGCEMWWDHSANTATCVPQYADRDFYLGTCVGGAAAADTLVTVNLNARPSWIIDTNVDNGDTIPVLTAGAPFAYNRGGMLVFGFSATAEAQKLDWFSKRSFPLGSNWIVDIDVDVTTNADADVADLSLGVANATHASDFDSVTESAIFHFDMGADLNIDAESDDGTTEVGATDTTLDWAVGTTVRLTLDGRDPSDVRYYVNGVEVLNGTANLGNIAAATGPLKLALHLEKSSNDSPGEVKLRGRVRLMEQDAA